MLSFVPEVPHHEVVTVRDTRLVAGEIPVDPSWRGVAGAVAGALTLAKLAFLTEKGCDTGQGYLFGRPMPADELRPGRLQWAPAGAPTLPPK